MFIFQFLENPWQNLKTIPLGNECKMNSSKSTLWSSKHLFVIKKFPSRTIQIKNLNIRRCKLTHYLWHHLFLSNGQIMKFFDGFAKINSWSSKNCFVIKNFHIVILHICENVKGNCMCFIRFHHMPLLFFIYTIFNTMYRRLDVIEQKKRLENTENISCKTQISQKEKI